jgi:cold shock CspA family protein
MTDDSQYAGRLTWWNGNSYGFITPDGSTQDDVFVHKSELPEGYTVKVGDRVTYRVATDRKRLTVPMPLMCGWRRLSPPWLLPSQCPEVTFFEPIK